MQLIPTISELFNGIISSLNAQFNIAIPTSGKSFLRDLGAVWSGKIKNLYLFIANVQKNAWFDLADYAMLIRFGMTYLKRLPYAATQGQYTCTITGTAGAVISVNTTFTSDPNSLSPGFLFILDTAYMLTGSGDVITLRATTSGTIANLAMGNTLSCTKPLINASQTVTVSAIAVSPEDAETVEEYRQAIQTHVLLAPQGGAVADYIIWASAVQGVAKVYPYTSSGNVWEVDVYIEAILSDSGGVAPDYGYGVPTGTILNNATAAILTDPNTGLARKPMGVVLGPGNVGAIAVIVYQVAITFTGSTGISAGDKALIIEALQQAIANIRPFIAGSDNVANQNDTLSLSLPASGGRITPPEDYVIIIIAMNAAPGALFTGVSMTVNGTGYSSYTFDKGIIGYLKASNVLFT